jgi:hypothetical protein
MRYILILLIFSGCSANWHLKRAISKGIQPEVEHHIVHDTVHIETIKDRIVEVPTFDTMQIVWSCDTLKKAVGKKQRDHATQRIQEKICPKISVDSTYQIELEAQGKKYKIPIHVVISSDGERISYDIKSGALEVPFEEDNIVNKFVAKYGVDWKWLVIAILVALIVGFVMGKVIKVTV